MEQLRDIKGLVEVPDYSFYYLLVLIGVILLVVIIMGTFLYKKLTQKVPMTQQKMAIELLEKFEVTDAKSSAYEFSHLAQYAVNDEQRQQLESLLKELEVYKFKKEVPELDAALKERLQSFVKELRRG